VDSAVIQAITESLPLRPQTDGDLEPFKEQINELHKVPPTE
jgi:hypothetical protein